MMILKLLGRIDIKEKKFGSYALYAFGEILLIVIGILIAFQIDNWNNSRQKAIQEQKIYANIQSQLTEDLKELARVTEINNSFLNQSRMASDYILKNNRLAVDTLAFFALGLSQFSDFHRSANIYETLVNSGDFKLLKNDSIQHHLQKLEMTYNSLNKLEDIHWELISSQLSTELKGILNYTTFQILRPYELYSVDMHNLFFEFINLMTLKKSVYQQSSFEVSSLLKHLNSEVNGSPR